MPKVPNYDNFSVDINAAPGDRFQAGQGSLQGAGTPSIGQPTQFQPGVIQPIQINNVPALSEGLASIGGRQMMGAGDALQRAGTSMAQIAFDAQRQMNELRVDDSLNKANEAALKLRFDKDSGFMSQLGEKALYCVFQTKLDTQSTANWTVSPEQTDRPVHGKLDTDSRANWTPLS